MISTTCFILNLESIGDIRNGRTDPVQSRPKRGRRNTDSFCLAPPETLLMSQYTVRSFLAILINWLVSLPFMDSAAMLSPHGQTNTATCGFEILSPATYPAPGFGRMDMIQRWPGAAQSLEYKTLPVTSSKGFSASKPLQGRQNVLRSSFATALEA